MIARNSTFVYKGKAIDVKQVGRELGVRYVLEGSVRKSGNRVRVTGQLIDAASATHVWAERYDRALDDIFALQDELTMSVIGAIEPTLRQAEIERASASAPTAWTPTIFTCALSRLPSPRCQSLWIRHSRCSSRRSRWSPIMPSRTRSSRGATR